MVTIKAKKSTTTISTRIILSSVGIAIILGLSALSTGGGMLLQPAAAAPKDDCEKSGGIWVQLGKIGFCYRELKPDECTLEPVPEPQDPPLRVCGGLIVVDPDTPDEDEDLSLEETLDLAFDLADIDVDGTEDGTGGDRGDGGDGGGDGGDGGIQEEANVSQQESTQDRRQGENNVNQNTQTKVQRQVVIDDDGSDSGGGVGGGVE